MRLVASGAIMIMLLAPQRARAQEEDDTRAPPLEADVALGIGGASLLVGGAIAASGAIIRRCDDHSEPSCAAHFGLLVGGVAIAATGGGVGLGVARRLRRDALGDAPSGAATRRSDPAVLGVGVTLTALGATSAAGGFVLSLIGACSSGCSFGAAYPAGPVLLLGGSALLAVGAPLTVLSRDLVADESLSLDLRFEPGGASLDARF